jgi:exodeoxyribonuclease VII large subunit
MSEASFGNLREYTVSELAGALRRVIEDGFRLVRVRGEVSRVTRPSSGHVYLDLKDADAVLSAVIWQSTASRLKIAPEPGMEVVATGKISTFQNQSRYQLIIDSVEPAGVGALMALLEERKKKLAAEGLFAAERKRAIPYLPDVVGVVTSPTGAVIRDILHRLKERFPRHVIVWPTPVQGKGAELSIAAAIDGFNRLAAGGAVPRPDVMIVARGGGGIEDLWCFNEEAVVRAVAASRIPVISAVGHETDTTLIDLAADHRSPTPTAAAERAVPVRSELMSRVANDESRLISVMSRLGEQKRTQLKAAARGLGAPQDAIGPFVQRFDRAADQLQRCARARLDAAQVAFERSGGRFGRSAVRAGFAEGARRVERATDALRGAAGKAIDRRWRALAGLRLSPVALGKRSADGRKDVDGLARRLGGAALRLIEPRRAGLVAAGQLLDSLSYENVLERGFALVRATDGRIIARAAGARPGPAVSRRFADDERAATIDGSKPARETPRRAVQKTLFD